MRLVTFEIMTPIGTKQRIGAFLGNWMVDLNLGYTRYLYENNPLELACDLASALIPSDMIGLFKSGKEGLDAARETLDYLARLEDKGPLHGARGETIFHQTDQVRLKAPVPRPCSIRDYSSYQAHVEFFQETPQEAWFRMPVCYKGNPGSVIGPEDTIFWPGFSDRLDYEMEYGIYIGKEGINIPRDQAREHIAGYTIFNDISARDWQQKEMTCYLGPYKGKDTCNVMGPCLVTPDEVDPADMRMVTRVNNEVWSEGNSGTSHWTVDQLVEYASLEETLYPGDFLAMGTIGKGSGIELDRWIRPGDLIEMEAEGIGTLRNRVGEKRPRRVFAV